MHARCRLVPILLGLLLPTGCSGSAGEPTVPAAYGPPLAAPRLVPAPLPAPAVELPGVAWPPIAAAPVTVPALQRPPLIPPELVDPYQVDLYHQQVLIVDVLWVVDNTGSMADDRSRLAASFDHFIRALQQRRIDYHIGVITTLADAAQGIGGELRQADGVRFLTPETGDDVRLFAALVEMPATHERREQGLEAMRLALSEPLRSGANADFLRSDGALAVIVVTDEDDGSFGPPAYFSRFLRHTRVPGDEGLVSFSAIAGLEPAGCTPAGEEHVFGAAAPPASRYLEVVERTGGLQGSICETDFDPLLEALGRRVSSLSRTFALSSIPRPETLTVRIDGQLVAPIDDQGLVWSYVAAIRSVVFEERAVPPSGSEVRLAYVVDTGVQP